MTERPRLAHLTTTDMSLDWLLGPQLRAFQQAGYEVIGISAPGAHVAALEAAGVRHVAVTSLTRAPSLMQDLRALRELRRVISAERPDILHTHNPKPGVLGRLVGRAMRVPVVVNTQHGLYAQPSDARRRRWSVYALERVAAACSHAELVQSREDVATLVDRLHVPASKVVLLGNGIDLARFDPAAIGQGARERLRAEWGIGADELLVGVVGRLVAEKGLPEIFAVAQRLRDLPLRFVVIGPADDDKPDALGADAIAAAAADGVVFAGRRDDMPDCYAACDLFATASHREGFPRSAMEAGAMGLPIVATDIRGCREVVDHGVNGVLVPVSDPAALAAALRRLAGDAALRGRLAASARAVALQRFDQQRVIDLTLATYARLLSRGTRHS